MPQPKCSNAIVVRVPGREDGRAEPLDVAVLVARGRADVVGGDDPATSVARRGRRISDDAEPRQLVVAEADRRAAELVEDLVERVGVDRRGQAVADARGPDRDARLGAPGVRRQVVGQLGDRAGRCRRGGRAAARRPVTRAAIARAYGRAPAELRACGSQSNVSVAPSSSTCARRAAGSRAARRGASTCRLPRPRGDDRAGRGLRSGARASPPAPHRACRHGSAPRSSAASAGRGGWPTGPARARSRPRSERTAALLERQTWVGPRPCHRGVPTGDRTDSRQPCVSPSDPTDG